MKRRVEGDGRYYYVSLYIELEDHAMGCDVTFYISLNDGLRVSGTPVFEGRVTLPVEMKEIVEYQSDKFLLKKKKRQKTSLYVLMLKYAMMM